MIISDPKSITFLLRRGGRSAGLAKTWFANVKERKKLINCAKNKLLAAVDIIATKHTSEAESEDVTNTDEWSEEDKQASGRNCQRG
jgi:hypothetical protein